MALNMALNMALLAWLTHPGVCRDAFPDDGSESSMRRVRTRARLRPAACGSWWACAMQSILLLQTWTNHMHACCSTSSVACS